MGVHEFYKGFEAAGFKPSYAIAYASIAVLYCLGAIDPLNMSFIMAWIAAVVCASMIYGFKVNERKLEDMTATLLGIMYVGFLSYHIVLIDKSENPVLIWLVFLAAFGTDIMAYFTGMAIGKHLSLIHISEPTRQAEISYAVFCLKKKKNKTKKTTYTKSTKKKKK